MRKHGGKLVIHWSTDAERGTVDADALHKHVAMLVERGLTKYWGTEFAGTKVKGTLDVGELTDNDG